MFLVRIFFIVNMCRLFIFMIMEKLEKKFANEAKKAKRFNETSKDNIDELKALLQSAKEKLKTATKSRKKLVEDILSLIK